MNPAMSPSPSSPQSLGSSSTPYSLAHFVNADKFSLRNHIFLTAITAGYEHCSFKEAMQHAGWREAMQKEISAL